MKSKNILHAIILLFSGLLLSSCKDKITDPALIDNSDFRFTINIKDTKGNPVKGLRVSAWGVLSIENQLYKPGTLDQIKKQAKIQAQTSFTFSFVRDAYVKFSVFNLLDQEVAHLIDESKPAGLHQISWDASTPSSVVSSGAYKCRIIAKSITSDSVFYQDSVYAVLHQPDPQISVLGWTSQSGMFETANVVLFSYVLNPPTFLRTNSASPDIIGTFNYTDSVSVCLTDTITHEQEMYYLTIGKQKNTFNLTWNPAPVAPPIPIFSITEKSSKLSDTVTVIPVTTLTAWKLYQNYPNPFN
jgi:hypothetical protein